jgi:hypothetical protein
VLRKFFVYTVPWNLGVHEASQERIQRVIDGEWIELPNNKVECWYPDTVKNVVEGSVVQYASSTRVIWAISGDIFTFSLQQGKHDTEGRTCPGKFKYHPMLPAVLQV